MFALIETSVNSILRITGQTLDANGNNVRFPTPFGTNKIPDGSVSLPGQGLIAVEVLSTQPWRAAGQLAMDYQQLGFHHLVCMKMMRVAVQTKQGMEYVDGFFYLHFDFVLNTANLCCFSGVAVVGRRLVNLSQFALLSTNQMDRIVTLLNVNDDGYWNAFPQLPRLQWLQAPGDDMLRLALYDDREPLVAARGLLPVPFDTTGHSVDINLADLMDRMVGLLVDGYILDWDLRANDLLV